ncbi:hypothetical protein Tco_0207545, partial [Tanacetum coccineum]
MNMLNRNCKTSFAILKKAQRANPCLYDIGCYNDNLALMLAPESDETIRLDKESRSCKTSFAKPEFLKKAQRANPRLYDIGCYNDNLALMLAPESDETIRLTKESRSKLSDLIRPFDYDKLNNLYYLFVPQQEKSPGQHYFPRTSKMSHTSSNNEFSKESFRKQTT